MLSHLMLRSTVEPQGYKFPLSIGVKCLNRLDIQSDSLYLHTDNALNDYTVINAALTRVEHT